jgi:hypothetical protein
MLWRQVGPILRGQMSGFSAPESAEYVAFPLLECQPHSSLFAWTYMLIGAQFRRTGPHRAKNEKHFDIPDRFTGDHSFVPSICRARNRSAVYSGPLS